MGLKTAIAAAAICTGAALASTPATAQDRYLGEVILVGHNFCPRGTMPAEGQLLPISTNTALFSLLGTQYGGDGRTTFGLPDLRGRAPVGVGGTTGREPARTGGTTGSVDTQGRGQGQGHGQSAAGPGFLAMHYCVVTEGIFPSRR